jgi:hypothetical protein
MESMRCTLVSHTHWDREWYRTHEDFRGRLVDAIDSLLDRCADDPGYHFLLDGQTIVLEDYLDIRPTRRGEIEALCRQGRIAIGPWYVQPDSLLPSGEAHVRNLLEGRRVGETIGPVSRAGYTPDSFGHPAQFPQIFAGFGIDSFIYWRGNGDELEELPAEYWWEAPDGSRVLACHMASVYFIAATGPLSEPEEAARRIGKVAGDQALRARAGGMLLMNGVDHALPEPRTAELAEALEAETGWSVKRGVLEDFLSTLGVSDDTPTWRSELVGGRSGNLLPGVWSARSWIKVRNRRCESRLEGWAEPFAALGGVLGLPDERPALRRAWRRLLENQAHDSICGCSRDEVHAQMIPRFDASEELAHATTARSLERIAGHDTGRVTPWKDSPTLAVFNPSPHVRTDVVRFAVDPHPFMIPDQDPADRAAQFHPLTRRSLGRSGFSVDGVPVVVHDAAPGRLALLPDRAGSDLEFVAEEVPAFGWKAVTLAPTEKISEDVDDGREIAAGPIQVVGRDDGRFDLVYGERRWEGLGGLLDRGDRGDTYDFDPVDGGRVETRSIAWERRSHPSGIERLILTHRLEVPAGLCPDRSERSDDRASVEVELILRVAPGVERVDATVTVLNDARDHRLQMLFPTGAAVSRFDAATTFDVVERTPGPPPVESWIHPPPSTFPCQGWLAANGLGVAAPGLAEGEVFEDGTLAVTLLRAVSHLSRHDLKTRPSPAGPGTETPEAQCQGRFEARLSLVPDLKAAAARDAELGLRAVTAGEAPLWPAGVPALSLAPGQLVLSALKPPEVGDGLIVRVLNPTRATIEADLRVALPFAQATGVRLDESPTDESPTVDGDRVRFDVPAHALRTVLLR